MRYKLLSLFACLLVFSFTTHPILARTTETKVTVRALSKGAKFIGSSMEGAQITITDAKTGEVLDQGITSGSTGNTDRIMREKHGRNRVLSTPETAKYTTSLWLEKPRTLKFKARGPMSNPEDANTSTVTQKVLPGKDLTGGDAIRLQIPGFVVDILEPTESWFSGDTATLNIEAEISMMCGCPIKPDGLWDANDYELKAVVHKGVEKVKEFSLEYAGKPSHFEGKTTLDSTGCYELMIYAYDPVTGNTGYETQACTVSDND